ncbi:uncharacterized protein DUF3237 [Ilumatobacter fluminis]|uniref:UPF0311 protein BDK89_2676 n=1 Tax=Ilumatobacter fluminis TaxID=467091 RepID=A0A4R7I1U0_9ACTN|nr:DUF3237 domain-containing protein [Ilumatobacter fluminis]TDT17074.1 uncharacterized protein DUF3237 [Ilumatobacter fluminis]
MELRHLMTIRIAVNPVESFGRFPFGERRLITFDEGTFEGADLRGTLLPGGVDWQLVAPDGTLEIRAHYALRTDRGESIEVVSEGVRAAPPEVLARLAAGEQVDPDEYYFRTHIRLSTDSERLDRLNRVLGVARGERAPGGVAIHVHEVL